MHGQRNIELNRVSWLRWPSSCSFKISRRVSELFRCFYNLHQVNTRVGTLIVATIYLQLIQNRYVFRRFTVLQCSHQHCVQPVATDVEVVGYL